VTRLKVADILANSAVPDHLDAQRVEVYRHALDRLPLVVVFETEDGLLMADGYHDALAYAVNVGPAQKGMSHEEVEARILDRYGESS
jgi:hypothetical protein